MQTGHFLKDLYPISLPMHAFVLFVSKPTAIAIATSFSGSHLNHGIRKFSVTSQPPDL